MTIDGFSSVLPAAQEGSEWAWKIIVENYAPDLERFFRARGLPDPEALAGEVFVDIAERIASFNGDETGFRSWVFVIAYRRMSDEWRRRRRRPEEELRGLTTEADLNAPSAENQALDELATENALRMLDVLTDTQRDVIVLRVIAGLSLAETAEAMRKPTTAIKALQRRAIAALRREIDPQAVSK